MRMFLYGLGLTIWVLAASIFAHPMEASKPKPKPTEKTNSTLKEGSSWWRKKQAA